MSITWLTEAKSTENSKLTKGLLLSIKRDNLTLNRFNTQTNK